MINKALSQSEQDSLLIFVKRMGYGYVENIVTSGGVACCINGEYVIYNPFRDVGQAFSLLDKHSRCWLMLLLMIRSRKQKLRLVTINFV